LYTIELQGYITDGPVWETDPIRKCANYRKCWNSIVKVFFTDLRVKILKIRHSPSFTPLQKHITGFLKVIISMLFMTGDFPVTVSNHSPSFTKIEIINGNNLHEGF
jgi:hypothetical protein